MTTTVEATLARIDEQIASRSLLSHPFYQAWTRGQLSNDALKDYAIQYYRHVAAFPTYLSALHSRTEDAESRRRILANLIDEEAGSPNHPELWLQFAERMGAAREHTQSAEPWAETRELVNTFRRNCGEGSPAEGIAALYAYESQIPAVAASKLDGLEKFYGITDAAGTAYFRVHEEADKEHSAVERALLAKHLEGADVARVEQAVATTLDALWNMLSAVRARHAFTNPG